jgi:hypothetical protein
MIGEDLKALVSQTGSSEVLDPVGYSFECGVTTPEEPNQQECLCVFLTKYWSNRESWLNRGPTRLGKDLAKARRPILW